MHELEPSSETIYEFLDLLFGNVPESGLLALLALPSKKSHFFPTGSDGRLKLAAGRAAALAREESCYFGVGLLGTKPSRGRGSANDVIALPGLWADIDVRGAAHKQTQLPPTIDSAVEVANCLGLPPSIVVRTGNGIHAYWLFDEPWVFADEADRSRAAALASGLQSALRSSAEAQGWKMDSTADLARVMRLPGTVNRKSPERLHAVTFEATADRYGIADIEPLVADHQRKASLGRLPEASRTNKDFPPAAIAPILEGCQWMRRCADEPDTLPEPDWHAMLSIVGRCKDGETLAHQLSEPYPGYSPEETTGKLQHALKDAGPATCEYVETKLGHSDICNSCIHRGRVKSPVNLGTPRRADLQPWPDPEPLAGELPPVPPLDPLLLPSVIREWVVDISDRLQAPLDFAAATAIVMLSAVIGRRAAIAPKQFDNWRIVPNLYGAIVGRPGIKKSPTLKAVLQPLTDLEWAAEDRYQQECTEYEIALKQFEANQASEGSPPSGERPQRPVRTRFIVNDSTVEKLQETLAENPWGVLYMRDELTGLLASMGQRGRETDRSFFLEAWDGDQGSTVDRIGRGTVRARYCTLGVFGAMQPAKLREYFADAARGGNGDDGFAQRLQVLVWPDVSGEWRDVDRPPNEEAALKVKAVLADIVSRRPDEPELHRFNLDAQKLFKEWQGQHEIRVRSADLPTCMEAHLSKYVSLMPSLALIFHAAQGGLGKPIPLAEAERAISLCEYLEAHAHRAYSCMVEPANWAATELARRLKAGALGVGFSTRDLYKKGWTGLAAPDAARAALRVLQAAGWVRQADSDGGPGRPSEQWLVNPMVYQDDSPAAQSIAA